MYPTEDNRVRLRALQREVKKRIAEERSQQWDKFLSDFVPSHQAFWGVTRKLKSEEYRSMPPLIGPGNSVAFEDHEKAECLADSLEQQCSPNTVESDSDFIAFIDSEVERLSSVPPSDDLAPVTAEEVMEIIKTLPIKKAPGLDGISNRVLRSLPEKLIMLLVVIFNAAIQNCVFPDAWKDACVVGIPKPGKPQNSPISYRPISLIKTMGKLYERLLLNRLQKFVHDNNILIDEQFGFRPKHSCVHQVHRIVEHCLNGFFMSRYGQYTGAIFLDVAKAFDKVWHNGLIYKLYNLQVPDRLVLIIRDYLSNRSLRYRVEGVLSNPRPIRAGVPQGSILAPLLYNLYTNDIPIPSDVKLALYADDTALYTSDYKISIIIKRLQTAVQTLGVWFRKWRIDVNPEKSVAVLFSKVRINDPKQPLLLFDQPIQWAKQVKYLGVTLDKHLNFSRHVTIVRNRASFFLSRLYPLLGKNSKLSLRNKLTIYKTVIRPVLTYASVVFAHVCKSTLNRLQTVQNKFLRNAVGAPWCVRDVDLHDDLKLETLSSFMRHSSRRYFDRVPHHPNKLVRDASIYLKPVDQALVRNRRPFRRPKHVLDDPDDVITAALKASEQIRSEARPHPSSTYLPRHRRRRRRRRWIVRHRQSVANRRVLAPMQPDTPTRP